MWVCGYPRSGTTLIASYLSQSKKLFYVGESIQSLKKLDQGQIPICSCGKKANESDFWSKIFKDNGPISVEEFNDRLSRHTPDLDILDSSKFAPALADLFSNKLIIHIVKDLEGVLASRKHLRKRRVSKGTHPNPRIARMTSLMTIYDAIGWMRLNLRIRKYAEMKNANYISFSYTDFCKNPDRLVELINQKYSIGSGFNRTFNLQSSHILQSNLSLIRQKEIIIDHKGKVRDNLSWFEKLIARRVSHYYRLFNRS